jgi:Ran GTPase-activating protein (RanGAP) involved in mRNA processing and transport
MPFLSGIHCLLPYVNFTVNSIQTLKGENAGELITAAADSISDGGDDVDKRCRMAVCLRLLSYTNAKSLSKLLGSAFEGEVNLEHISFGYHELSGIAMVLSSGVAITSLEVAWNKIGDAGTSLLFQEGITAESQLQRLDMTKNDIGTGGAAAIAKSLATNTSLLELMLSWNMIDNDGSTLLAKALETNKHLKTLRLKNNNVGGAGALALSNMLRVNGSLKKLILWQNDIGNEGAAHLAEALKVNVGLVELNVKKCGLEVDFEDFLCEAVKGKDDFKLGID